MLNLRDQQLQAVIVTEWIYPMEQEVQLTSNYFDETFVIMKDPRRKYPGLYHVVDEKLKPAAFFKSQEVADLFVKVLRGE